MSGGWPAAWDLSPLFAGPDDPRLAAALAAVDHKAKILSHSRLSRAGFPKLVRVYEAVLTELDRVVAYAGLLGATQADDPATEALRQRVEQAARDVRRAVLPFELAWSGLPEAKAASCLATLAGRPSRHGLAKLHALASLRLDFDRERLLADALDPTRQAFAAQWRELAGEAKAGTRLSRLSHPDRRVRAKAAGDLAAAVTRRRSLLARTLAGLLTAARAEGEARGFGHWLDWRAAEEETAPAAVEGLVAAVRAGFPLVGRYYRLKARLLGLPVLADHDRLAPVPPGRRAAVAFPAAKARILAALSRLSPVLPRLGRAVLESGRIDAAPRPGKAPGAFCRTIGPGEVPFLLLNAAGSARDAAVLAHELGHALHHMTADPLGPLAGPTAALGEAAAVTVELALSEERLQRAPSDAARLAALCGRLEDDIATLFRQAALHGFEDAANRRKAITADDVDNLWTEALTELFQGAVAAPWASGWAVTPHFFLVPGYVHVYVRAGCLAHGLMRARTVMGPDFAPAFAALLAAGGSKPLRDLLSPFDLDPGDPGLARFALARFAAHLEAAEALAARTR